MDAAFVLQGAAVHSGPAPFGAREAAAEARAGRRAGLVRREPAPPGAARTALAGHRRPPTLDDGVVVHVHHDGGGGGGRRPAVPAPRRPHRPTHLQIDPRPTHRFQYTTFCLYSNISPQLSTVNRDQN